MGRNQNRERELIDEGLAELEETGFNADNLKRILGKPALVREARQIRAAIAGDQAYVEVTDTQGQQLTMTGQVVSMRPEEIVILVDKDTEVILDYPKKTKTVWAEARAWFDQVRGD